MSTCGVWLWGRRGRGGKQPGAGKQRANLSPAFGKQISRTLQGWEKAQTHFWGSLPRKPPDALTKMLTVAK